MGQLTINRENLEVITIVTGNSAPVNESDVKSSDYVEKDIIPRCLATLEPCKCNYAAFITRQQQRASILAGTPQQQLRMELDQEVADGYIFRAVVQCDGSPDNYTGCSAVFRQCKTCGKVDIWGDIGVLAELFAEAQYHMLTE